MTPPESQGWDGSDRLLAVHRFTSLIHDLLFIPMVFPLMSRELGMMEVCNAY